MIVTRVHGCTCTGVKLLEISAANYQTPVIVTARQSDGRRRYCGCCRPCVRLSDLFRRVRGAHNYHRDDTAAAFCWASDGGRRTEASHYQKYRTARGQIFWECFVVNVFV